jgi:hypothetical protein
VNAGRPAWVIMVITMLWLIFIFMGQVMSYIDYDFTVSLGLQESRNAVTDIGVAMNKGFGVRIRDFIIQNEVRIFYVLLYVLWGFFAAGLAIALPVMIKDGFFKPGTIDSAISGF